LQSLSRPKQGERSIAFKPHGGRNEATLILNTAPDRSIRRQVKLCEERIQVTSARANRDTGLRQHRVDPAILRPVLRAATDGHSVPEVVPLNLEVQQQLVLGALIEKFGGESTGAALTRHLSHQLHWTPPAAGPRLVDVLQALHRFGALSLEANGENDVIVRLLPDGAELYV
jgi:hypothetical protein